MDVTLECRDDVVYRVETEVAALFASFVNGIRDPVPGEQRIFKEHSPPLGGVRLSSLTWVSSDVKAL